MKTLRSYGMISVLIFISILFTIDPRPLSAQSFQLTSGNSALLLQETRNRLYETDPKRKFVFEDLIVDKTSYPFIETNISLLLGSYSFQAFNYEGQKLNYSTRGEKSSYHDCKGDVCILLTDRNILAVTNYASDWSKTSFYNEEKFSTKLGDKAAFVVTDRAVYMFNGFLSEWTRIGLESEVVTAVSNKNELALIVTSKRIFFFQLTTATSSEINVALKPIRRYEIRSNTIECFSYDRVFQYDAGKNQIAEVRTDQ